MIESGLELTCTVDQDGMSMPFLQPVSAGVIHLFSIRLYLRAFTYWIFTYWIFTYWLAIGIVGSWAVEKMFN